MHLNLYQKKLFIQREKLFFKKLLFKMLFTLKWIKIFFFNYLKIIFDISASKNINFKQRKNKKNLIFLKSAFEIQKQT